MRSGQLDHVLCRTGDANERRELLFRQMFFLWRARTRARAGCRGRNSLRAIHNHQRYSSEIGVPRMSQRRGIKLHKAPIDPSQLPSPSKSVSRRRGTRISLYTPPCPRIHRHPTNAHIQTSPFSPTPTSSPRDAPCRPARRPSCRLSMKSRIPLPFGMGSS